MLLLAALGAALVGAPAALADVTTTTYNLPAEPAPLGAAAAGSGLTSDAAGNVWFSTGDANATNMPRVGRFVPAQGVAESDAGMRLWPTPLGATCCATQVRALDFDDEKGRLWLVRSDGTYGYGDAAVLAADAQNPFTTAVHPQKIGMWGVAYDPTTKRTWIAETNASNVATPPGSGYFPGHRMASTDGGLGLAESKNLAQQNDEPNLVSLRYEAKPRGAAPDGKGEAWFVESDPGNPGYRIGRTNGSGYLEYLITPCPGASPCSGTFTGTGPTDVTVGKDGSVWFTNHVTNSVGRLDPVAATFTHYSMASMDPSLGAGKPFAIRTAPDGSIWVAQYSGPFVNQTANAVVKIVPGTAGAITATVFKTGNAGPLAVEPTVGGDVYYLLNTASAPGKLGRISGATTVTPGAGTGETPGGGGTPTPAPPGAVSTPGTTVVVKGTPTVAKILPPTSEAVVVRQICVGPPQDKCSLVYLLDSREFVKGFPGTKEIVGFAAPTTKKPKTVELGRTAITLSGGETKDVKVSLSKKAKALLKKKKKLKATLRVMERQPDGSLKKVSSKELTFKAKKKKK